MHASETWPITSKLEQRLRAARMKTLRWSMGKTKLERIRNDKFRGDFGVASVDKKIQGQRLRWFGHIIFKGATTHIAGRLLKISYR